MNARAGATEGWRRLDLGRVALSVPSSWEPADDALDGVPVVRIASTGGDRPVALSILADDGGDDPASGPSAFEDAVRAHVRWCDVVDRAPAVLGGRPASWSLLDHPMRDGGGAATQVWSTRLGPVWWVLAFTSSTLDLGRVQETVDAVVGSVAFEAA